MVMEMEKKNAIMSVAFAILIPETKREKLEWKSDKSF